MLYAIVGLCIVTVLAVNGEECDLSKCPVIPKHYEEMGCKSILKDGTCCPERFECPPIVSDGKCHYKQKTYEINAELHGEDLGECQVNCQCRKSYSSDEAVVQCVSNECPDLFNPPGPDCIRISKHGECCDKIECDKDAVAKTQETKCIVEGKSYHEGQKIYPDVEDCYTCICTKDFDNSTISKNSNCQRIDCGIPLHYDSKLRQGCAPVYYGKATCCPIDWICPKDDDEVEAKPQGKSETDGPQCTFGKLKLSLGDELKSSKSCMKCACSVPPMIHCIQAGNC